MNPAPLPPPPPAGEKIDVQAGAAPDGPTRRLPQFELPAPAPSARMNLPRALFGTPATLGDIDRRLTANLRANGYPDASYYGTPGGFALVTAIERIRPDGAPFKMPDRWQLAAPPLLSDFHLSNLLAQLRDADPGHYRVLVFLVTTEVTTTGATRATFATAQRWLLGGGDVLPRGIAVRPLTPDHNISVLIYAFTRPSIGAEPRQEQGALTAVQHMRAAGLLK